MTDNEIIKALECCINDNCDSCPDSIANSVGNCERNLRRDALDLINRLEENNKFLTECGWKFDKMFFEQKAEIKKLQAENDDLFYKLQGVMWFVDKWLDGDELEQDEVNRAVAMREKTLQITEEQQKEIERLKEGIRFERERIDNIPTLLRQTESQAIKKYIEKVSIKLADNARSDYWRWIDDTLHEVEREMVGADQ